MALPQRREMASQRRSALYRVPMPRSDRATSSRCARPMPGPSPTRATRTSSTSPIRRSWAPLMARAGRGWSPGIALAACSPGPSAGATPERVVLSPKHPHSLGSPRPRGPPPGWAAWAGVCPMGRHGLCSGPATALPPLLSTARATLSPPTLGPRLFRTRPVRPIRRPSSAATRSGARCRAGAPRGARRTAPP
jgi:hypothetical protein